MNNVFDPPRREKARPTPSDVPDASHLPHGGCRYILLHPEGKGRRCACVGFALNRTIPGSSCDCGHFAVYHEAEKVQTMVAREEYEDLKCKFDLLQEELRRVAARSVFDRVPRLEEQVENHKVEADTEFKRINQAIAGVYYHIGLLKSRAPYYEDHIEALHDTVQRMDGRIIDLDDASMKVEDRIEALERSRSRPAAPFGSRRRKASTPPSPRDVNGDDQTESSRWEDESVAGSASGSGPGSPRVFGTFGTPLHFVNEDEASKIQSFRDRVGSESQAYTVHVSLLPSSSNPFPYEKDTAAYHRCLSRGLHQVIVIADTDSTSFKNAVDEAFSRNLRGRKWHPLVARLCDAENLLGLPMLRQLEPHLIGSDYDAAFLQRHCSVNDQGGKILDLYIAMADHTISWAELKQVTPYKKGLEDAWIFDRLLDGLSLETDAEAKRPAAGDMVTNWPSSLKRPAAEISRSASFGSTSEGEENRAKLRRQCISPSVDVHGKRVDAV